MEDCKSLNGGSIPPITFFREYGLIGKASVLHTEEYGFDSHYFQNSIKKIKIKDQKRRKLILQYFKKVKKN